MEGKLMESTTITIFGIYFHEDEEGLFFEVEGKMKKHFCSHS